MSNFKSIIGTVFVQAIKAKWPYVAIAFLLLPDLYWIIVDHSIWPWDQAWYGEVTVELWYVFIHDPIRWPKLMLEAFGTKAPGIAWIGQFFVPIGQLSGSIEFGLGLSILLVHFGTLFFSYRIGMELNGGRKSIGLAGCVFVASTPLFVGLSTQYFVEPLQLFAVTYFFWIATTAHRFERLTILTHLFVALALAMAAKVTSPLYCMLPGVVIIFQLFRVQAWTTKNERVLPFWHFVFFLFSLAILLFITAWYVKNFRTLIDFMMLSSSGEIALDYGSEDTFVNKVGFWILAMRASFFSPYILWGFFILNIVVLLSLFRKKKGFVPFETRPTIFLIAGLVHIIIVLVIFSLNINEDTRYLLPLLPSFLMIFLWTLNYGKIGRYSLIALLIAIGQFTVVQAQLLSVMPYNNKISYWIKTPKHDSHQRIELSRLVDLTSTPETQDRNIICGVEYPWLNANTLTFYAAKTKLKSKHRCHYNSLGYAAKDIDRAWQRLEQLRIVYYLSVEKQSQPQPPNFINQISLPILSRIESDPHYVRQPFNSIFSIVVFRNTRETRQ